MKSLAMSRRALSPRPHRTLLVLVTLALAGIPAIRLAGQQSAPPPLAESPKKDDGIVTLNTLVVTGSTINKTELESANSIAVIDQSQKERLSPRSTADLLSQIPGLYVEPTAGQISNNYYIRGLPSGGGTKFLGLVEDGLPIVINNSDFTFRGDALTTDRVEVLRGGASSILTSYAAGGTINFITGEGSQLQQGAARLTFSDYGQIREDAYVAGPLAPNLTYMLGGYYNSSKSQRDTGWGSVERGGQLVGNLKYDFADNRGYFKVSFRHLDDQSAYFATELYENQQHPQSVPGGPNISNGTYYGPELSRMTVWTGAGPILNDFSQGVPVRLTYGGTELKYKFDGGWTLLNRNRYTNYYHKFNGLFGGNTADGTGNALASYSLPILIRNAASKPGFSSLATFATYRVTDAVTGALVNPTTMNGNGAIQLIYPMDEFGLEKNFQNDFQVQKEAGDSVTSFGLYYSTYNRDFTQFGNQALTDVADHAHLLNVEAFDAAGNSLGSITDNGFTQYGAWYTRHKYKQTNLAPYITEDFKLGQWRFDAGWRHEDVHQTFNQGPQTAYSGFIARDVNQRNPALYGGNTVTAGPWVETTPPTDKTDLFSAGANYLLSNSAAVYARYSVGTYLSQDAQSTTPTPESKITQMELGYRGRIQGLVWNATLFNSEATNNGVNVGIPVNGTLIFDNKYLKTRNYGVELLATWKATRDLAFDFQGTLSKSGYQGAGVVTAADGTNIAIDGKRPVRQPDEIFSVTGRYSLRLSDQFNSEFFVTDAYTGKRPSDIANSVFLPSYNLVNAGVMVRQSSKLSYKLQVSNLFNAVGLTEGNPRQTQVVGNANAVYYGARAIFGRSVQASVEYHF